MSKKMKCSREQSFRRTPSPIASPSGRSRRGEVWLALVERFAEYLLALGYFTLCLTHSFKILATLYLEAIGIFPRSQGVDLPLVVLGCSVVLGLRGAGLPIRARSSH